MQHYDSSVCSFGIELLSLNFLLLNILG